MIKPWTIHAPENQTLSDDFFVPLWKDFTPKDFYFAIQYEKDTACTLIYITPRDFYLEFGKMYNESLPIIQFLPTYLEEVFESVYETIVETWQVRSDLFQKGFINNPSFQRFVDEMMSKQKQANMLL